MELLEWLRQAIKCDFISDMRFGMDNELAKTIIRGADFSEYSLCELSDAANYLFGADIKFNVTEEAKNFICKLLMCLK